LPIAPGKDQVLFQYAVPYTAPTYEFNLPLAYDTARFGLYLKDVGATVRTQQLSAAPNPMGTVPNAPKLISLTGDKFAVGTTIKATFDKLPAAPEQAGQAAPGTAPTSLPVSPQTIGLVILSAAIVSAVALLVFQMRRKRAQEYADEEDEADPHKGLLQEIADLDDAFEAGNIGEAEYKEKRAALKAHLAELDK
jgi:hypothetical protein